MPWKIKKYITYSLMNMWSIKHYPSRHLPAGVVLFSLLLTWTYFTTLFYCFYCQLWTCNCRLRSNCVCSKKLRKYKNPLQGFFYHLSRAVPTHSVLFEKWNAFFSVKISKNTCRLGGCRVLNVLNLEKYGVNIHNCALLLHFIALVW